MPGQSYKVSCIACRKSIYRSRGSINENLKFGHNFYCSRKCEYRYKTKAKSLSCEHCGKVFMRQLNDILTHNYCSRSCAATVNNTKFPKRARPFTFCLSCGSKFKRDGKYCSRKCGYLARIRFTDKDVLKLVRSAYKELNRVPVRRELKSIAEAGRRYFGSWNKAIIAAGLKPHRSHDHRMYKRMNTKASDGHLCDSISEAIIDNWLTKQGIAHIKGTRYPGTNFRADWVIGDTFVEYFGLLKDSPRYDREVRRKRNFCKKQSIKLVEIYPTDLYPKIAIENKLNLLTGP